MIQRVAGRLSFPPTMTTVEAVDGRSMRSRVLSQAGGRGLRICKDDLPVFPETVRMGRLLGIDPLGLIGSGSLLICCRPDRAQHLVAALEKNGIAVADIGAVTADGPGIDAVEKGAPVAWPVFEVDEITKLYG